MLRLPAGPSQYLIVKVLAVAASDCSTGIQSALTGPVLATAKAEEVLTAEW